MSENIYVVKPYHPKDIIWDKWPEVIGETLESTYDICIGLQPRNQLILDRGTVFQIRPEFRISNLCSIIVEMPFHLYFLQPEFPPPPELILQTAISAHTLFAQVFLQRTGRNPELFARFDYQKVRDAILQSMSEAGW